MRKLLGKCFRKIIVADKVGKHCSAFIWKIAISMSSTNHL